MDDRLDRVRQWIVSRGGSPDDVQEASNPIGMLLAFERKRLGLSYDALSNHIARRLEAHGLEAPTASGLFRFERQSRALKPDSLRKLALVFGWDLRWLRELNGEDQQLARSCSLL